MAAESSPRPGRGRFRWETSASTLWRLIVSTVGTCMRNRVTGLAAEAAFFAVLSLPPLIFALAGSIGYVFAQFSDSQIGEVRNTVLDLAGQALTPQTVNSIIRPTLNEVLSGGGRYDVDLDRLHPRAVVGLAGAQRLRRHHHDHVRPRRPPRDRPHPGAVVPALRARHDHRRRHHPAGASPARRWSRSGCRTGSTFVNQLYWPTVLVLCICFLATLYHVSVPVRTRWRYNLPGRGVHDVLLGVRLRPAAARAGRYGARAPPRSTVRSPRRSRCCCGSTCSPSPC